MLGLIKHVRLGKSNIIAGNSYKPSSNFGFHFYFYSMKFYPTVYLSKRANPLNLLIVMMDKIKLMNHRKMRVCAKPKKSKKCRIFFGD